MLVTSAQRRQYACPDPMIIWIYHLLMTTKLNMLKPDPTWASPLTKISPPKALDSGISYQHPFKLFQTSRHSKKPQFSSLHIISTSTNQHYIYTQPFTQQIRMVTYTIPPSDLIIYAVVVFLLSTRAQSHLIN